jgi:hypothetical protein
MVEVEVETLIENVIAHIDHGDRWVEVNVECAVQVLYSTVMAR